MQAVSFERLTAPPSVSRRRMLASVPLPTVALESVRTGQPMEQFLRAQERLRGAGPKLGELPFFVHQPEEIRQQWRDAVGLHDADGISANGTSAPAVQKGRR